MNYNHLQSSVQLLKRNQFKGLAELNVFLIYIGKGMFKQNIYVNEGKFETAAQSNIINIASIVQAVEFIQTSKTSSSSSK